MQIKFFPINHAYFYNEKRVSISVTGLVKKYFDVFNAEKTVDDNYKKWKDDDSSLYYTLIHSCLEKGEDDAFACRAILNLW